MPQKPEIQYVGQFYVYGSEAKKIQEKKRQTKLKLHLIKPEQLSPARVDYVAIVSIAVAVIMLAVMVAGVLQIQADWAEYKQLDDYVSRLNWKNEKLTRDYRASFNLDDIESKALGQGLIPKSEAQNVIVHVSIPVPEPEPTRWDWTVWFLKGLFA